MGACVEECGAAAAAAARGGGAWCAVHAFGELWVGSGRSTTWLCTSLSSCNTTTNLQIQKRTSRATESRKKRTSSPTLQRRPAESARREGGRRRETKFSKALLLKGIEDAENIPDTTHFHPPWGRESRKFFSTIESSLYVISVRNVLLDHLPSSCVSKEGDLSGSRTPAPPTHSD